MNEAVLCCAVRLRLPSGDICALLLRAPMCTTSSKLMLSLSSSSSSSGAFDLTALPLRDVLLEPLLLTSVVSCPPSSSSSLLLPLALTPSPPSSKAFSFAFFPLLRRLLFRRMTRRRSTNANIRGADTSKRMRCGLSRINHSFASLLNRSLSSPVDFKYPGRVRTLSSMSCSSAA